MEDARYIRERAVEGIDKATLARKFGVSRTLVRDICAGRSWPEVCKKKYSPRCR